MQHGGLGGYYSSRDDDQRIKVRALPADGNKDSVGVMFCSYIWWCQ